VSSPPLQPKGEARPAAAGLGDPPFLGCPFRWRPGRGRERIRCLPARTPKGGSGPPPCPAKETRPSTHTGRTIGHRASGIGQLHQTPDIRQRVN
jgi:hypothetical protein